MNQLNVLNLVGLSLNTIASLILLVSYLNIKKNVNDDLVTEMDDNGKYTQIKHLKERTTGLLAFTLYLIGFILQLLSLVLS